jgi:uncharacterized membrane protein HdeD (DUF308 family)
MYWITGILGLAFAIAPFVLGYSANMIATWTSVILGLVVIVTSAVEYFRADKEQWEYWVAAIVGLLAVVAPFVLGFGSQTGAMWTSVIAGVLLVITAGSKIWTGQPRIT